MDDRTPTDELSDDERAALEEVERGMESFHRAHGALVEFHHMVGRGMDHFEAAERRLDEEREVTETLRDDVLPAGVTDDGTLTYELGAEFEAGLLAAVESAVDSARADMADGRRYPLEREERGRSNESA